MIVLDREKLLPALKGKYRASYAIQTSWVEEISSEDADEMSPWNLKGLFEPFPVPIPK